MQGLFVKTVLILIYQTISHHLRGTKIIMPYRRPKIEFSGTAQIHGNAKRGQSKGPGRGKVLKNGLFTPPLPLNTEISSRSHNNPVSVSSHPHPLSAIGPAFSRSFQQDSQFLELPVRSQKPTPHNSPFHLQHNAARMAHHTPYARVKHKSQRPGTVTPQRFRQKQTL